MVTAVSELWTGAHAWLRAHPLVGDALLATGLLAPQLSSWLLTAGEYGPSSLTAAAWSILDLLAITIRRRWPLVAVAMSVIYSLGGILAYPTLQSSGLGIIVIGYTLAVYLPLRRALAATSALWAPALLVGAAWPYTPRPVNVPTWYLLAFNLMIAVIAFFVGRTVHNRRAYTRALEERARTAERNQRAPADQTVADERRRIARELHDVVAHHVSVMGVLATGAHPHRSTPAWR